MKDSEKYNQTYNDALDLWGNSTQIDILIEEMSELTKAFLKARRNHEAGGLSWDVLEELVDVDICLEQIRRMFLKQNSKEILDLYDREYSMKITRLQERIKKAKEDTTKPNEVSADSQDLLKCKMLKL